MITIVAGLGRCGSSLVMSMLKAGGIPLFANRQGSHEHTLTKLLPSTHEWMHQSEDCAVKILDIQIHTPPPTHEYKMIWCVRDPKQQALSMLKHKPDQLARRTSLRKKERWIIEETPKCMKIIQRLGRYLVIPFEITLKHPDTIAASLAAHLGVALDEAVMAAVVKKRSPEVYTGFLEEEL